MKLEVIVEIDGKKYTMDEARKLYDELEKVFSKNLESKTYTDEEIEIFPPLLVGMP